MSESESRTVLVVDDHDQERRMLSGMLRDEGWRVEEAPSADDAFARVAPGRFDAMVLDVNMPGTDGLTAMLRFAELDPALPDDIAVRAPLAKTWRAFEHALQDRIKEAGIMA